ncbi:MAG: D-alanine--D-alanine ligase [Deltaproteobacteria bacterium]|nr:D-alanine--D-alanine ligase [Deltaproteobacteria bacterium]
MKINLLLVFGGKSGEHEVSLRSARNVYNAIDRKRFNIFLLGIEKNGTFKYVGKNIRGVSDFTKLMEGGEDCTLTYRDGNPYLLVFGRDRAVEFIRLDVAFPILHGTFGEDGTIQGLFEMVSLPYVGGGVLASAVCMDKEICKRVLRDNGIKIVPFYTLMKHMSEREKVCILKNVVREFGYPLFVKPANLGSSVGISKVKNSNELEKAIAIAFRYDTKIIVEKGVVGREIECAVIGNEKPQAAVPGEVVPINEFYDYEAKYIKSGSKTIVPADLDKKTEKLIRALAIKSYIACNLEGMARVDFFLTENDIFVNEINSIPGFTEISMFPMMWEASGLNYKRLIGRLIELALERKKVRDELLRSYCK